MEKGRKARVLERLDGLRLHSFEYGSIIELVENSGDFFEFSGISLVHGKPTKQYLDELEFEWVEE